MNPDSVIHPSENDLGTHASNAATDLGATSSAVGDIKLEILSPLEWDELATEFVDLNPEQTGSFNVGHWGAGNVECFVIRRLGHLIGGGSVITRRFPLSSKGIAVLKWGPVWRRPSAYSQAETNIDGDYEAVVSGLIAEYCDRRGFHLTIMPPSIPEYGPIMCQTLRGLGFTEGAHLAAPKRYIVNTHQDTETMLAGFDQKYRYNLRKALKNNFEIKTVEGEEGLNTFMDLYRKMIDRKGFLDASAIGSLETFVKNSPGKIKPQVVLVSHEDKVTAGGIIFSAGEMASYMFGATDDRALRLKAGYAMHWWVCQQLCADKGVKWYDLGGNDLDAGLHQFKKGMVGKTGEILNAPPRYHYANGNVRKLLGDTVFRLRDAKASAERTKQKLVKWLRR